MTSNSPAQDAEPHPVDPLADNIDNLAAIRARFEQQVSPHQRRLEAFTLWLGRPQFFFGILIGVLLWMLVNLLAPHLGLRRPDDPPFFWLQGAIGLSALLMTTVILITQNRQAQVAERRDQLELQVSLLTEQRTAKIIELLEELRRDMPNVHNRVDPEADALQESVDPHVVLTALEFKLEQALDSANELEEAAERTEEAVEEAIEDVARLQRNTPPHQP